MKYNCENVGQSHDYRPLPYPPSFYLATKLVTDIKAQTFYCSKCGCSIKIKF